MGPEYTAVQHCGQVVRRNGGPSLADQISDRIAARILDCELAPGSRLPGQRELARRFQVDRRTVGLAYRRLASRGLVEVCARSGAVVRSAGVMRHKSQARGSSPADSLFAALVEAHQAGVLVSELAGAAEVWSAAIRDRRVAVECPEPELTARIRAELAAALPGLTFVGSSEPGTKPEFGLPLIALLDGVPSCVRALDRGDAPDERGLDGVSPIRLHLGLGRTARAALAGLQDGHVVGVISRSRAARRIVRRAISTLPETTLGFAEADPQDEDAAVRVLGLSELVLGQVHPTLIQRAGFRGRCLPLTLVAPASILAIRDRLGVPPQARTEPCSASKQRL